MKAPWDSPEMLLYSSHIPVADPGKGPGEAAINLLVTDIDQFS